jgi:hypothetical protein
LDSPAMLDDKAIRGALINFLENKKPEPKLIVEELGVHNGNAIADVVAIYDSLHGFEIKGESDSVSRISKQSRYYNLSFPKLTLVTTQNHMDWVQKNLPEFWGVLLAKRTPFGIGFTYKRSAKNNPFFSKEMSLLMLWKEEMLNSQMYSNDLKIRKKDSRAELASKIAPQLNKDAIVSLLKASIANRMKTKATQQ